MRGAHKLSSGNRVLGFRDAHRFAFCSDPSRLAQHAGQRDGGGETVLRNLFCRCLHRHHVQYMHEHNVRIRFIGYIQGLSEELQTIISDSEALTKNNTGLTLQLAINYGGRDEIVRTVQGIAHSVLEGQLAVQDITEQYVSSHLYTQEFSDVDLLIRPSKDYRISNFLLWQLAYAEFWFTDLHWPDFTKETLLEAIAAYQKRERRFGGLQEE